MPTDVIMPQMGESIFEGTITKWLKQPGETVQRDEPLFEISTDKVDAEIPRPPPACWRDQGSRRRHRAGQYGRRHTSPRMAPVLQRLRRLLRPRRLQRRRSATRHLSRPLHLPRRRHRRRLVEVPRSSCPQMGESIFEGTITKWLKKVGGT